MLEIVHYFNQRIGPSRTPEVSYDTNEVNSVPHDDPDRFSFSILSTYEGSQLKSQRTNTWIDSPINSEIDEPNIGVLCLGETASILTGNRFEVGIRRVASRTRLTVWQKVCTESHIKQLFERNDNTQLLPAGANVTLANQPNSKPIRLLTDGEIRNKFMQRVDSNPDL